MRESFRTSARELVSVIIPVLNEESNIQPLYHALQPVMERLSGRYDFEILYVDDHSTDRTFEKVLALARADPRVRGLRLSKSFGHQKTILTGYRHARGRVAIQMDGDLQDPPALIPEFLSLWEMGYEVVYGIRQKRKENPLLQMTRMAFYRMLRLLSDDDLPLDSGDFRLVGPRILDELRQFEDCAPYLRGAIANMGFRQVGIPYDRPARLHGESKIHLWKMLDFAADAIVSHSLVPLRLATYAGLLMTTAAFLAALAAPLLPRLVAAPWSGPGGIIPILQIFGLGLNALFLGILGEYVGRIYHQVRRLPLTIIEEETPAASCPVRVPMMPKFPPRSHPWQREASKSTCGIGLKKYNKPFYSLKP